MLDIISQDLAADLASRWERMRKAMRLQGADGCLLSSAVNLYYAAGAVFNGYFYLPEEGQPWFFVKRPNGLSGDNVVYIRKPEQITEILKDRGVGLPENLLMEGDELPYNGYTRLLAVFGPLATGNATSLLRQLRSVKSPWEIDRLRFSAAIHEKTYAAIPSLWRAGMTDIELQAEIERVMRLNGSLGIFRAFGSNMDMFMGSVLAGDNAGCPSPFDYALGGGGIDASIPVGANGTVLRAGTAIMVDMAGNYTAYLTDMTRVFSVGVLSDEAYRAHDVSIEIQRQIEKAAHPGSACSELYEIAVAVAAERGLADCFMGAGQQAKFVGHGIGLQVNELPILTPRSKEVLEPGVVFALEPKFIIAGVGAVGIENSFLVTDNGVEKLTNSPEEIIPLS